MFGLARHGPTIREQSFPRRQPELLTDLAERRRHVIQAVLYP
jgi:hypothetical protein